MKNKKLIKLMTQTIIFPINFNLYIIKNNNIKKQILFYNNFLFIFSINSDLILTNNNLKLITFFTKKINNPIYNNINKFFFL